MKKLLVFAITMATLPCFAGKVDDILIMTNDSISAALNVDAYSDEVTILSQDFTPASEGFALAVKTKLIVNTPNQEWTCVTQFVKTPKFFEVSKTECK